MIAIYHKLSKEPKDSLNPTLLKNILEQYKKPRKIYTSIQNLQINTQYSDFGASVYKGTIYFSSSRTPKNKTKNRYQWNNQPYLNIYKAKEIESVTAKGQKVYNSSEVSALDDLNSIYHDAGSIITKDGKTIYFTRDNFNGSKLKTDAKRTSHLKIYKATLTEGKWQNIEDLPFNNENFSNGHPALSSDEKTLYFVSDRPGGFGETDIYKVDILEDNTYSIPVNLGGVINTDKKEMFPFVSSENKLYFSSNGHLGIGGLDVFESKMNDTLFEKPINLGAPINSPKDDFSFYLNLSKKYGYFSSNREGGKGDDDIYSFSIYECKEDIVGVVYNSSTQKPLANTEVSLFDSNGKKLSSVVTDMKGNYVFPSLECTSNYTVKASKLYYVGASETLTTKDIHKGSIPSKVYLTPLIVGNQIVVNPIYFDFDKFDIRKDAEFELEKVISVMKAYPSLVIKIESHTDSRGNANYNRLLSDKRAKATQAYIISRGIQSSRIESAIGYGEDQLLNNCNDKNQLKCSEEEHQINRRSYFYVVSGLKEQ